MHTQNIFKIFLDYFYPLFFKIDKFTKTDVLYRYMSLLVQDVSYMFKFGYKNVRDILCDIAAGYSNLI